MDTPPTLIGPAEAAKRLGIHRNTLMRWELLGYINPVRLPSGARRYDLADIDAILAKRASA